MKRYSVVYERDETGWWIAQVKELPSAITQGRTIAEARRRIRESLALALGSDRAAKTAELIDEVRLPADVRRAVDAVAIQRAQLERDRRLFARATGRAALKLMNKVGLSVRDTGELLGLSHQRIQQLKTGLRAQTTTR